MCSYARTVWIDIVDRTVNNPTMLVGIRLHAIEESLCSLCTLCHLLSVSRMAIFVMKNTRKRSSSYPIQFYLFFCYLSPLSSVFFQYLYCDLLHNNNSSSPNGLSQQPMRLQAEWAFDAEAIWARGIIVLVKSNQLVKTISRQNIFRQLKLELITFLPPKRCKYCGCFSLLVGYNIQPSSSSTNQNVKVDTYVLNQTSSHFTETRVTWYRCNNKLTELIFVNLKIIADFKV